MIIRTNISDLCKQAMTANGTKYTIYTRKHYVNEEKSNCDSIKMVQTIDELIKEIIDDMSQILTDFNVDPSIINDDHEHVRVWENNIFEGELFSLLDYDFFHFCSIKIIDIDDNEYAIVVGSIRTHFKIKN